MNKRDQETLDRMRQRKAVAFRDLVHLLEALGFRIARQRGSHRVYKHPNVPGALVLQPMDADAKKYQIRQVLDKLEEGGLLDQRP